MKILLLLVTVSLSGLFISKTYAQNLPKINTVKKTFILEMDMTDDTPLLFGYETADINSKKVICFSSFTKDVDNNPNKCELGAYYEAGELDITYVETSGNFVKLIFKKSDGSSTPFYMQKKDVSLE